MKPIDFAKAAGVAIALLALNLLLGILGVVVYSVFIHPGETQEFYNQAALKIVPWIVHIASPILFLVAGYLFARRRPDRNGLLFATTFAVVYAIVDGAMMGYPGILSAEFLWSMLANLAAGMIGAVVGGRKASRSA